MQSVLIEEGKERLQWEGFAEKEGYKSGYCIVYDNKTIDVAPFNFTYLCPGLGQWEKDDQYTDMSDITHTPNSRKIQKPLLARSRQSPA